MVKKKIIIVISGDGWGGAEKQAFLLKEYLGKNFMTEIIWLRDSCDKITMPFNSSKTAIHYLQNPFQSKQLILFFLSLTKFWSKLFSLNPYALISFGNVSNRASLMIWKFTRVKHFYWNQRDAGLMKVTKADIFFHKYNTINYISNSNEGIKFLKKELHAQQNNIYFMPNLLENINPKLIKSNYDILKKVKVCMIGNFKKSKDHKTLIKSFKILNKRLKKHDVDAILYLIGRDAGMKQELKKLIDKMNLNNFIIFTGWLKNTSKYLHKFDIGVFSSNTEGMPNALIEMMQCGLPIVANKFPTAKEVIPNENYKFLSENKNPSDLCEKLYLLIRDKDLRAENARFNLDKINRHLNRFEKYNIPNIQVIN
tara:strand:+ start:712 stop:1815 length:1104 start_codon:yes stop_codon:yes gene_type:complete